MSNDRNDFVSGEAILDDEEDEESFDEENGEPKRRRDGDMDDSSEEEEDEDEEEAQRVAEGFIVDEDEDEEDVQDEGERRRRRKRRRQEREEEEQLDEDDLDLIGETIPDSMETAAPSKFKRLKRGHREENERRGDRGLAEIFSDEDEEGHDERAYARPSHRMQQEEFDDFIEDDFPEDDAERRQHLDDLEVARPGAKGQRTGGIDVTGLDPESLDDMRDIFGVGEDYDWAIEKEEAQEAERQDEQGVELRDVFEPSQLVEKMLTKEDEDIRWKDEPERFQIDRKPYEHVTIDDSQFKEEVVWIVRLMWPRKSLFRDDPDLHGPFTSAVRRVLEFLVVDSMEVPYIFQHKKDYLIHERRDGPDDMPKFSQDDQPETVKLLNQDDLWRILDLDIKFKAFIDKRNAIEKNYSNVQAVINGIDEVLSEMLYKAETMEELQDLQDYLNLVYAQELKDIALSQNTKETKRPGSKLALFLRIRQSRAYEFVKAYGLSPTLLGRSLLGESNTTAQDNRKQPLELADDLTDDHFMTGEQIMSGARQTLAEELSTNPVMRKFLRKTYFEIADISIHRTEKGLRKIDEGHPYYEIKYLINQTISDMASRPELYLKMLKAEEEGLVQVKIALQDPDKMIRHMANRFKSDNYSEIATAWNEERSKVVELAFPKLDKLVARGVKESLRNECQESVLKSCRSEYGRRLDQAPYKPNGLALGTTARVLALSNGMGEINRDPVYWSYVEEDGKLLDHGTFSNLGRDDAQRDKFVELVQRVGPDVIAVSGFSADSNKICRDIQALVKDKNLISTEFEDDDTGELRADLLEVIIVNDEVARLYKDSPRGTAEFPSLHPMVRYCFALCKYVQDPLKEYAAMGKDIATIKFHPCQNLVPHDKLTRYLNTAMVDMVNLVGVDINLAVSDQYIANLLPFVAGLGPRKATQVTKMISNNGGKINLREELVGDPDSGKLPVVGPRVFNNCASFLFIEYDKADAQADPLDNTRVHPEDYELGRKMAADALELYDEDVKAETDENGPAAIIRMLFRNEEQHKVNELVLEEYAEQLERKFSQRKRATLETIRAELIAPYEELRRPFGRMTEEEVFQMFTGESKESLDDNVIVPAIVRMIKDDFAIAKLDCGIEARIESHQVSHRHSVKDALQMGQTVRGVITNLKRADFSAELNLRDEAIRRADMVTRSDKRPPGVWDKRLEDQDRESMQVKDKSTGRAQRVIKHPLFKPFNKTQAEEFLGQAPNGDAVIRPSSLGSDHITITWKVSNGVFQHLDVLELEKENEFSVGKKLRVGTQIYSDLDELIFDHVKAMGKKVDDLMRNDKFHEGSKGQVEEWLKSYCAANPNRSNYRFSIDTRHPGYFYLMFKASRNANTGSWMVKVIPQGYEMMRNKYPDMKALCNGFKLMFQAEATKQMSVARQGQGIGHGQQHGGHGQQHGGHGSYGGGGYGDGGMRR